MGFCGLLSALPHREPGALLVLLPLSLGAWAAYRSPRFARSWAYVDAVVAASFVGWTGGARSPLLPYLLASGLTLGLTSGAAGLLAVAAGAVAVLAITTVVPGSEGGFFVAGSCWVALSLAVGLVAVWSRHLALLPAEADAYGAVRRHLQQLRALTRHLPGGLEAGTAAQALLERCARVAEQDRAAVLVETSTGVFVPLAVRGTSRLPWRTPVDQDGPLWQAWVSGRPALDRRDVDLSGRRQGSTLLALPLLSGGKPFGLVVVETHDAEHLGPATVEELRLLVAEAAPQLETALLFEEVRLEATTEERDRLAREMHDGVAQELAYLGYQLDELRAQAGNVDADLGERVAGVRADVTTLISELRLSITDLRTTVRPERGIGDALGTYLRAVCAGRDLVLNLTLQESPLRLPVDHEVALLRVAQLFAQEVRRSPAARELTVQLVVDPPSAALQLHCDCPLPQLRPELFENVLRHIAADVMPFDQYASQPHLEIRMKGSDHDERPLGRRPRTDSAGTPARV